MIVSHRHHRFEGAPLECDRWIGPHGILRRVLLTGMTQEERLTMPVLGRGVDERARARLMIVVRGSCAPPSKDDRRRCCLGWRS
ncbi:Hypothetical protein A7982_08091 [Minicystis rosea]|nr:Hypothetical protein A7982_08091 [Minicystis rosea]